MAGSVAPAVALDGTDGTPRSALTVVGPHGRVATHSSSAGQRVAHSRVTIS